MQNEALRCALERQLENATPEQIVEQAIKTVADGRLAVVSSFGIESAALLDIVANVDRSLPILFVDTGWLFGETLAYRDALIARFNFIDIRTVRPDPREVSAKDPRADLWSNDVDACCNLRKVEPLVRSLAYFEGWMTGRKRFHGGERSSLPVVELDGRRLKFNPLAALTEAQVAARFHATSLPPHPLAAKGYRSIGCLPCSTRSRKGEGVREGRWRGTGRSECGIHELAKVGVSQAEP